MIAVRSIVSALAMVASGPLALYACPFCNSDTADQVRANIFNADFVYHLGIALAPFPVLIAVLVLVYFGWPPPRPPR